MVKSNFYLSIVLKYSFEVLVLVMIIFILYFFVLSLHCISEADIVLFPSIYSIIYFTLMIKILQLKNSDRVLLDCDGMQNDLHNLELQNPPVLTRFLGKLDDYQNFFLCLTEQMTAVTECICSILSDC